MAEENKEETMGFGIFSHPQSSSIRREGVVVFGVLTLLFSGGGG